MAVTLVDRVVEVVADRGPSVSERYSYGSGCVVVGRTVLTSAHVVAGAVGVSVRTLDKREWSAVFDSAFVGDPLGWRQDGSAGPDLALVTIADEQFDHLPPLRLARVDRNLPEGMVDRVRVVGFPWFAERHRPSPFRTPVDVAGQIGLLTHQGEGLFGVDVTIAPPPRPGASVRESQWSGMSGAPVLVAGRLVGVVAEHAGRGGDSSIIAVPLTALDADPDHPLWGPGVGNSGDWWQRLGVVGPDDLERVPPLLEPPYWATLRERGRALHRRMPRLEGRHQELGEIAEFATSTERYRWLVGGAFTGKSALLYEVVNRLFEIVDVVCYFLSARAADSDSSRFLEAVIPQLEVLCGIDRGPVNPDRFRALWEEAEQRARLNDHHLLLLVDGLDEDLQPPGQPSVAALLPIVGGDRSHVLVSSRPGSTTLEELPSGHPMAQCGPVELTAFAGAVDIADDAKAEIDRLVKEPSDRGHVGLYAVGHLTAAGGPLSASDLAWLYTQPAQPSLGDRADVLRVLERAARSLEVVGSADEPLFQFAHEALRDHARANKLLVDEEFRTHIHLMADHWRDQGWPSHSGERSGTPRYLLDAYPGTLAGDCNAPGPLLTEPQRLVALVSDLNWLVAAIQHVGVDRVIAALLSAADATAIAAAGLADVRAVTTAQAIALRSPVTRILTTGDIARQLGLQAIEYDLEDLADRLRFLLRASGDPGPIPYATTVSDHPPQMELGTHPGGVRAIVVLPGDRVVSGGGDGRLLVWDREHPDDPVELGHHPAIRCLTALNDGRVVSGGDDGRLLVWNPHHPDDPVELNGGIPFAWGAAPILAVTGIGDGRVLSADADARLWVWDLVHPGGHVELRPNSLIHAVIELSDGRVVTAGRSNLQVWSSNGFDDSVALWYVDEDGEQRTPNDVYGVAELSDGRLVTAEDGGVRVWDPDQPGSVIELYQTDGVVLTVAVLSDDRVVQAGTDGRVRVLDPDRPDDFVELGTHYGEVRAVATLGVDHVVSGAADHRLRVWRTDQHGQAFQEEDWWVETLAPFGDGRVAFVDAFRDLRVWDPNDLSGYGSSIIGDGAKALAVSNVDRLFTVDWHGRVGVWRPDQEDEIVYFGIHEGVELLAAMPDGRVVTGDGRGRVRLWNPDATNECVEFGTHHVVSALAARPDGHVVTGHEDGRIRVWDPDRPGTNVHLGMHQGLNAVTSLADGRIISGGRDRRVRMWDPDQPGQAVELGAHHGVNIVAALADGRVISGGRDGWVRVWDPDRPGEPTANIACGATALGAIPDNEGLGTIVAIGHGNRGLSEWTIPSVKRIAPG